MLMPKFKFTIEGPDGNLLREGTGLFEDRKHAKETLLTREQRRHGPEHAESVKVSVSEAKD